MGYNGIISVIISKIQPSLEVDDDRILIGIEYQTDQHWCKKERNFHVKLGNPAA
jgi:hypothetical protein